MRTCTSRWLTLKERGESIEIQPQKTNHLVRIIVWAHINRCEKLSRNSGRPARPLRDIYLHFKRSWSTAGLYPRRVSERGPRRDRFIHKVTLNGIYTDCVMHYRAQWLWEHSRGERQEKYGSIYQRLGQREKGAARERERERGGWGAAKDI